MELEKFNLWGAGNHVGVKQLWEYFARYPYLSRLKNEQVLKNAIQEGFGQIDWQSFFAYAAGYDNGKSRYAGLRAGERTDVQLDGQSVLVKPEVARAQLDLEEAERQRQQPPKPTTGGTKDSEKIIHEHQEFEFDTPSDGGRTLPHPPSVIRHFSGSVNLNPLHLASDASRIAEAIVQHLAGLPNANVTVRLEIQADTPEGVPETVKRIVSDNAATLRFRHHEFE
jgi:hypothetical protein